MAYLDDTGLAYFWGKIKAWANSVFALLGHTHPASDVTLMTGYSKPASGSAIAASDTLNQAVGKLEAKADAALDDSNYVHKAGDELVAGMKFFTYDSLFAQSLSLEKGVVPQTDDYLTFLFLDKNAAFNDVGHPRRLGAVNVHIYPDGGISNSLMVYKNESGSSNNTYLTAGYDAAGIAYGRAPSTSTVRTDGNDIVTRNFIPLDTRIVHTTGNESVGGVKTFTDDVVINADKSICKPDNTGYLRLCGGTGASYTTGAKLALHGSSSSGSTGNFSLFTGDANGYHVLVGHASTGALNWDGNDITGDVHTTGNETIAGDKKFTDAVTIALGAQIKKEDDTGYLRICGGGGAGAEHGAKIALCGAGLSGTSQLEAHAFRIFTGAPDGSSYISLYGKKDGTLTWNAKDITGDVHKTGDETIKGIKTFDDALVADYSFVQQVNPYLFFIETDTVKGSTNNSYQGIYFCDKNHPISSSDSGHDISSIIASCSSNTNSYLSFRLWVPTANSTTSHDVRFAFSSGSTVNNLYFYPSTSDGNVRLGSSAHKWNTVFASTASINTSDARKKSDIENISDDVLDAWDSVLWKTFRMNDAIAEKGDRARVHSGIIAQDIKAVFEEAGLDPSRYAFYCYDSWEATENKYDAEGRQMETAWPAGDCYSVRYEEALCIEAAYMRRENVRLKKRVADLEDRLAALELRLGSE